MFVQCSPVLQHVFLIAIWFQWSLKRYLDVNCSKNAGPPCNKINMQGHFRAFKPSWSKALGRWLFAGAIQDFVVRKVFNYNPMLGVLRGCRHQFCVCSFFVEFSGSSLHSHPWKPLIFFRLSQADRRPSEESRALISQNIFLTIFCLHKRSYHN